MKDFRKYTIWQDRIKCVKNIYSLTQILANYERFGLISQFRRASVSIPSNITEDSSRNSKKEFKSFLEITLSSAFKHETLLIIIQDVYEIKPNNLIGLYSDHNKLQRSINSLIQKIKNN